MIGLLFWLGCAPLDAEDCAWFEDCARFVPEGALCGLAHRHSGHFGGSCQAADGRRYDPAMARATRGIVSATDEQDLICPEGYTAFDVPDVESGSIVASCAALESPEPTGGELWDVPQGAACGLSSLQLGSDATCMGSRTSRGECPEGWRWRWVPDELNDFLDEDCQRESGGHRERAVLPIAFCEPPPESEACTDDCPPVVLDRSWVCGLHARSTVYTWGEVLRNPTRDMDQGSSVADLHALYDAHLDHCEGRVPALPEALMPQIRAAMDITPTCLGRPVEEGCPGGLQLQCTAGWTGSDGLGPSLADGGTLQGGRTASSYTALCWCGPPGAVQYLPAYDPAHDDARR